MEYDKEENRRVMDARQDHLFLIFYLRMAVFWKVKYLGYYGKGEGLELGVGLELELGLQKFIGGIPIILEIL